MAEGQDLRGQICWFEVPAVDIKRAADFYNATLGWTTKVDEAGPAPMPGVKAVHLFEKGMLHGCFLLLDDAAGLAQVADSGNPAKGTPTATFMVDSIEDTMQKIQSHGGKQHVAKTALANNMGHFARFIDSEGNLQAIWAQN